MSNTNNLLPCPFCGGEPKYEVWSDHNYHKAECVDCAFEFDYCQTYEELEASWNKRVSPAPCLHQIQEPAAAEQAAWHAGLDEGRAQAAQPSSVSNAETPQAAPAAVAWSMPEEPTEQMIEVLMAGEDRLRARHGDDLPKQRAKDRYRALLSLAATPAADALQLDFLPFSARSAIASRHGMKVTAEFNALVREVIAEYRARAVPSEIAAAAPVVLPEPDAVISELMGLVDEWGMESHLRGAAELDAQHSEATQEEIDCAKDRASKERAAWKAIESKLRALLAAGGEAQAAPAFYAALGSNGCALPQYSAGTEEGVILNVLSVARNEGYTGSGLDRLIELGWVVRPVYTRPTPATADSLATATGLPAQADVADEVNCVCGASWLRHGINNYEMTDTPRKAQSVPVAVTTADELAKLSGENAGSKMATVFHPASSGFPVTLYAAPQAQADARDAEITWPKARDVGRFDDMSPGDSIRVGLDSDNDVYVSVCGGGGVGSVEFCNPGGGGGGRSSRTRLALLALMVAMEADNADDPARDWWARRNTKAAQGGEA